MDLQVSSWHHLRLEFGSLPTSHLVKLCLHIFYVSFHFFRDILFPLLCPFQLFLVFIWRQKKKVFMMYIFLCAEFSLFSLVHHFIFFAHKKTLKRKKNTYSDFLQPFCITYFFPSVERKKIRRMETWWSAVVRGYLFWSTIYSWR